MKAKYWTRLVISVTAVILVLIGGTTWYIDPYFHYHQPFDGISYDLFNERYQNFGIVKHFEYDAIITGTSMSENFKTSEFEKLFDLKAVKVPLSGETQATFSRLIRTGLTHNPGTQMVLCSLDNYLLTADANRGRYESYPDYLYNDNPFDDAPYLWNKEIILGDTLRIMLNSYKGLEPPSFDEYANWSDTAAYGRENILLEYVRPEKSKKNTTFTDADLLLLKENLSTNIIDLAKSFPDTDFYYFFPPYSVIYWDWLNQQNLIDYELSLISKTINLLDTVDNIHVYGWSDRFDLTTNLDPYTGRLHYHEDINSKILQYIASEDGLLTDANISSYLTELYSFYSDYDYEKEIFRK